MWHDSELCDMTQWYVIWVLSDNEVSMCNAFGMSSVSYVRNKGFARLKCIAIWQWGITVQCIWGVQILYSSHMRLNSFLHRNECYFVYGASMAQCIIGVRFLHSSLWDIAHERWGAGVETQKNVRGEIGGWGRVPFNETYAPSLSTIYDGA